MQTRLSLLDGHPSHDATTCPNCATGCLAAYHAEDSHEASARTAWQEVVDLAFTEPALAVLLGAAMASVFVDRLGIQPVLLHLFGGTEPARAQALRSAMSVVGQPGSLVRDWCEPPRSILSRLDLVSPLPVALQGLEQSPRAIRLIGGGAPGTVIISAGQIPLPAEAHRPGRLEFKAPAVSGAAAGLVHAITTTHYGWPRAWLSEHPVSGEIENWFKVSLDVINGRSPDLGGHAEALALSATGFGALGRIVGRGFAFYAGMGAALRAVESMRSPPLHLVIG
ncbi:MAG TPA: DUF927 domain-containing protein [Actinomycetota bacterium]|nr:DUF927 domain-containing protein [Actinomycetota bacterium]